MKTIEERAYSRYAGNDCPHDCEECEMRTDCVDVDYVWTFIEGAQSEHEELTRWRSPNDIPDTDRYVLIKIDNTPEYAVGYYNGNDDSWHIPSFFETSVGFIGWREIHE